MREGVEFGVGGWGGGGGGWAAVFLSAKDKPVVFLTGVVCRWCEWCLGCPQRRAVLGGGGGGGGEGNLEANRSAQAEEEEPVFQFQSPFFLFHASRRACCCTPLGASVTGSVFRHIPSPT